MGYQRRVHGDCTQCIHHYNMFKVAIVVCLAAYAKAEAEADPALLYGAYGYAGYAAPYTYGYAGYPYAYSTLAGYGTTNGANSVGIAGVAPAAAPALAGGYAGAGRHVANSAGVVHVAKREAEAEPEAEADAGLLYGAYGYGASLGYAGLGYGYSGLRYAGYGGYGLGYGRLGYAGLGYYGKRSADAEPEADAGLYYGGYGYGAGLGYAGLGYGYSGLGYARYGGYGLGYGRGVYYG